MPGRLRQLGRGNPGRLLFMLASAKSHRCASLLWASELRSLEYHTRQAAFFNRLLGQLVRGRLSEPLR